MKKRNEIPAEYKWKLSDIFPTPEDWEARMKECEEMIPSLAALKGTLGKDAESLFRAYETVQRFEERFALAAEYAFLGKALDGGDNEFLARCGRVTQLGAKANAAAAFFDPELLAIPSETLGEFMKYPPLKKYAHIV